MKPITLYDVATCAGVSYQTVSRVMNGAAHVSTRTRDKVLAAMAALHYVPNRDAQQLAGKRNKTLGLLTTDLALHAPSQIASAVKCRAGSAAASVIISMLEQHDETSCAAALQELLAQRVSGVLINVPLEDSLAERLAAQAKHTPVLFLDVSNTAKVNRLVFDAEQGARLGVEHLLAQGHRHIALLGGPQSSVAARARFDGWLVALDEATLTPCASAHGDWSAASGYEKAHALLSITPPPQAILVANDQMALGVLRACAEKGLCVPGQVSVMGYDDTADSAWFSPPLTTVRQSFKDAGERSVDWLVNNEVDSDTLSQTCLPVTLVQRLSTAPAAPPLESDILAKRLSELALQVAQLGNR